MFSFIRKALAIGRLLAATRDDAPHDAPTTASHTRQRVQATWTASLKGEATCSRRSLVVTVTSAPHVHDVLAAATSIRAPASVPVFVLKHTTTEEDDDDEVIASDAPRKRDASQGVYFVDELLCIRTQAQVWGDVNTYDAPGAVEILHNSDTLDDTPECTALMFMQTIDLLHALYQEPGTVVWDPVLPGLPYIVLTPADESWDEFADRCSNQPIPQWVGAYLHVPLAPPVFSPFGPTEPLRDDREIVPVFSPSRFTASVCMALEQAPYQALFAQRHAYKAVAYVAALVGGSVRVFYDDPAELQRLDQLCVFVWTDPAAPLLEMWRGCFMITILESENPFAGVPHIVVNGTLPNAPWDVEPVLVPEQDEGLLSVPVWSYIRELLEEGDEDDAWYRDSEDEEAQYCAGPLSESEDDSDEARTPSPPSWPITFPVRNSTTRLQDVSEEDEDESEVPSVTEALVRKPWLQDEDDDEEESPPTLLAPPPPLPTTRFNFSATLSGIGEGTSEGAYRPLTPSYKPLWTSDARLAASPDGEPPESGDDRSVYTDALEEQPTDTEQSEDDEHRRYRRAHLLPRPSCDIFLNVDDDASIKSPTPSAPLGLPLPRGKANIPTGKIDWFDLPDDDLGEIDWTIPVSAGAT
ncbi:hypothetical protein B0H19DRAFT_1269888 [Mycena capillaripes]|nr:hypothetical protein B0H19DRAFT_1269888 [Mycena capillaripes]